MPPPCVNDSGISLGIALMAFYNGKKKNKKLEFNLNNAYYGIKDDGLKKIISVKEYNNFIRDISDFDNSQFLKDIENSILIWFDGASEIGPRALGNRSILGDPRKLEIKDLLNDVKQRQWWRPVAPIIMEEYISEWFENSKISPYMLQTFNICKNRLSLIPAIAHLDNSSRIQTIKRDDNSRLYDAIFCFYKKTGIPMLCNTSLNDRGEPIIATIPEMLNFALRKRINVCYVNGTRVLLKNHIKYSNNRPYKRDNSYHTHEETIDAIIKNTILIILKKSCLSSIY